jgi:transposase InsO family protein
VQSPRTDYTLELKRKVGKLLLLENPKVQQTVIADCLGVSPRTLNNWKRRAKNGWPEHGPVQKVITRKELLAIAREWKRQGCPGSRPVIAALPQVRVRVARQVIAALKLRKEKRRVQIRKKVQVRVRIHKPGTVLTVDGATIRKGEDHIVYRDRGSLTVQTRPCINGNLAAIDTMAVLGSLAKEERLPFVYCSDNGSQLCAKVVKDFLDKNYIVHLRSLPRVPQHNGSCENAVKEFKEQVVDGYTPTEATAILNERRKRQQLGYKTAAEFDKENFRLYTKEERKKFYYTAKAAIQEAKLGMKSEYEKRKAEREAIFQTMERFALITRTRGGQLCSPGPEESV